MKLSLRKNIHIRVGIFLCVIQVLCWTGASASSEPLLTTNSPFVLYMQNPPWIKELIFIKNAFAEGGPVPGQINVKGWVYETNRLAIQP
ncbi:MAG TPA: hypothetical protein VFM25_08630, partial [Verrucomicrobiae bacterium]|nr:hypothetical protein [Verrucomicrobiae bacterium]